MKLSDTRIATRLTVGFGLLFLLLALAVGVAMLKIGHIRDEFRDVMNDDYPTTMVFFGVKDDVNVVARGIRNMLLLSDPAVVQAEHERIKLSL
jgi:methyl-accepting chemotaxis protein